MLTAANARIRTVFFSQSSHNTLKKKNNLVTLSHRKARGGLWARRRWGKKNNQKETHAQQMSKNSKTWAANMSSTVWVPTPYSPAEPFLPHAKSALLRASASILLQPNSDTTFAALVPPRTTHRHVIRKAWPQQQLSLAGVRTSETRTHTHTHNALTSLLAAGELVACMLHCLKLQG